MKKKLIVLGALLAMALLVAAPAVMAQTITQSNTGDVISQNVAEQEAAQYQYAPGGAGGDVDAPGQGIEEEGGPPMKEPLPSMELGEEETEEFEADQDIDAAGGAGGEQDAAQYGGDQDATATGPTFTADQVQYCSNVVEQAAAAATGGEEAAVATAGGTTATAGGTSGGGGGGGGTLPATGGASLLTLGAGALLVAGGLVVRRIVG